MISSLSSELSELQNRVPDSDQTLSLITKYIEEKQIIEKRPVNLKIIKNIDKTLSIETSNGHRLNNLLPKNTQIRYSWFDEFGADSNKVEVPSNITSMGLRGKIGLSHEFGHVLHPEIAELFEKWKQAKVKVRESYSPDVFVEDKVDAFLNEYNLRMEMEIQGWQYGKAVADLLEIDSVIYEDLSGYCLESYFLDTIQRIANDIDFSEYFPKNHQVKILEPKSQEFLTMTLMELKVYLGEQLKNNRVMISDKKLKFVGERVTKIK